MTIFEITQNLSGTRVMTKRWKQVRALHLYKVTGFREVRLVYRILGSDGSRKRHETTFPYNEAEQSDVAWSQARAMYRFIQSNGKLPLDEEDESYRPSTASTAASSASTTTSTPRCSMSTQEKRAIVTGHVLSQRPGTTRAVQVDSRRNVSAEGVTAKGGWLPFNPCGLISAMPASSRVPDPAAPVRRVLSLAQQNVTTASCELVAQQAVEGAAPQSRDLEDMISSRKAEASIWGRVPPYTALLVAQTDNIIWAPLPMPQLQLSLC